MTFVFPLLLGGLVAAGVPILLHLIVRQKPKRLPFPAFRFLAQQHRTNTRKLRLRHLLLLALRVFLIAAMCLLLARPRMFQRVLGLDGERPVNAVLVFDTSASMEYRSSDGRTRLDDAKQRAREMLDALPPASKVAVIDSADARVEQAEEWLSLADARQRIGNLKIRPANATVTQALLRGLTQLDDGGSEEQRSSGPARLRLLVVVSDRTKASWDGGQVPALLEKLDRIPPPYEGLLEARARVGALQDLLRDLRREVPLPEGKDYNEQSLLEALAALQNDLAQLTPEAGRRPEGLAASLRQVRRLSWDLLGELTPPPGTPAQPARDRVRAALADLLRDTGGAQLLFVDVGMESPVDLALIELDLPRGSQGQERHAFAEGETFTLQAVVQATGKDAPATVVCQVGDARQEFAAEVKAGEKRFVPFEIGRAPLLLRRGDNPIEIRLATGKEPALNQRRYITVLVRPPRKVLVLVDDPGRQGDFAKALAALRYAAEVKPAKGTSREVLAGYDAVYLLGVADPDDKLWEALAEYVRSGGGVGIVPAGDELKLEAFARPAAHKLMPGTIERKLEGAPAGGSDWNWEAPSVRYAHSFMKRFKAWKDNPKTDFVRYPRGASAYWDIKPRPGESQVLVEYDDAKRRPAVLERLFDPKSGIKGKVLLLTTPLDAQKPPWNNYAEDVTSFYLALVAQATAYLAGEDAPPRLNFTLGRGDPVVALAPGAVQAAAYLRGPDLYRPLTLEEGQAQLVAKDLEMPGNYLVEGRAKDNGEPRRLAGFSLNIPSEECDLTKVPAREIEPLFPGDSVLSPGREDSPHDLLQAYRNEPLDLVPYFMLALLLVLALENLLANKFYRRTDADTA
jgi:hypothetical protein